MECQELRTYLHAYVDGELETQRTLDADAHLAFCMPCQWALAKEREFRQLLRSRARRDGAPSSLPDRVRRALDQVDRSVARRRLLRWATLPLAATVLLLLGHWSGWLSRTRPESTPPIVAALVEKHLTYARMATPAEIATPDRQLVAGWFKERVEFSVPVPDFTPSGIRLVGGRVSDFSERQVAYLLYEKGRSLISLFVFPGRGLTFPKTGWGKIGAQRYLATESKGHQVVMWTQGETAFVLVSQVSREALLECAEAVWLLMRQNVPTT